MNMKTCKFFLAAALAASLACACAEKTRVADPVTLKVAVVYEDMVLPSTGKPIHECMKTPGYSFDWNNPKDQMPMFVDAISKASDGFVNYEIVEVIDADTLFTYLNDEPEIRHLSVCELDSLLHMPTWGTAIERRVSYDYRGMIEHYGFDRKRDSGEINEVWVYSTPLSGAYESHMMGDGAFWVNSPGDSECSCHELLYVMFFSYERDLACALESYSHRVESSMMQVYGWWDYENRPTKDDLTTWDKFTGYKKIYDKYDTTACHVGNVHFPPNGTHDYDFRNETPVMSYADEWLEYPDIREENAREMNWTEWGGHEGWMRYWLNHIPHYKGINPADGHLNNWWYYAVDYKAAMALEEKLSKKLDR